MNENITTQDGLLYREGKVIMLPEADIVAAAHGFPNAERMVKALAKQNSMNKTNAHDRGMWTSASAAHYDLLCPGRHLAQQKAITLQQVPQDDTTLADMGTRIHEALAVSNPTGLEVKETELYDSAHQIEVSLLKQVFGVDVEPARLKGVRQQRLWIKCGAVQHSGEPDVIHRMGPRMLIIDYKFGSGDVPESPRNQQLRDLSVLAWYNTPLLTEIYVAIIQPLATHKPELCRYTKAEIEQSKMLLEQRVKESNNPEAPRMAGATQCKWCKARLICQEYQKWATKESPLPVPLTESPLAQWTGEQWAAFLEARAVVEDWIKTAVAQAERVLTEDPQAIPGYALVPGNVVEKIVDAQGVFDRFQRVGGTLDEFMQCMSVYKSKLMPFVKAHTNTKGQALQEQMEKLVAGLTESSQNKPSIRKVKAEKTEKLLV